MFIANKHVLSVQKALYISIFLGIYICAAIGEITYSQSNKLPFPLVLELSSMFIVIVIIVAILSGIGTSPLSSLSIDDVGVTVKNGTRSSTHRWEDIKGFDVVYLGQSLYNPADPRVKIIYKGEIYAHYQDNRSLVDDKEVNTLPRLDIPAHLLREQLQTELSRHCK
jgi:hypothetical protein